MDLTRKIPQLCIFALLLVGFNFATCNLLISEANITNNSILENNGVWQDGYAFVATQANSTYCFNQNISYTSYPFAGQPRAGGIWLNASNITLDCQGNTLTQATSNLSFGITTRGSKNQRSQGGLIKNCNVTAYYAYELGDNTTLINSTGYGSQLENNVVIFDGRNAVVENNSFFEYNPSAYLFYLVYGAYPGHDIYGCGYEMEMPAANKNNAFNCTNNTFAYNTMYQNGTGHPAMYMDQYAFGNYFYANNLTSTTAVYDVAGVSGNYYNNSTAGNIWAYLNTTLITNTCDIYNPTDSNGAGAYATSGTDLPLGLTSTCINPGYFTGTSTISDNFPWTLKNASKSNNPFPPIYPNNYLYDYPQNGSLLTYTIPCLPNGTNGATIGGSKQYFYTNCEPTSGTNNETLYYNSSTVYQMGNDSTQIPMKIRSGTGSDSNGTSAFPSVISAILMNETSGTTAYDALGSYNFSNNLAVVNQTSAMFGNAYSFNGSANITTSNPMGFLSTSDSTILLWFKPVSTTTANSVWETTTTTRSICEYLLFNVNGMYAEWTRPGSAAYDTQNVSVPAGSWVQVAVAHNGTSGNTSLYLNGTEVASVVSPTTSGNVNGCAQVGQTVGYSVDQGNGFKGNASDYLVFNKRLPAAEINQIYQNGINTPGYGNLQASKNIILVNSLTIVPNPPTLLQNLNCTANITSSAYGSYNVTYNWYQNGVNQTNLGGSIIITNNTVSVVNSLSYLSVLASDNYSCSINAVNGSDSSGWVTSMNDTEPKDGNLTVNYTSGGTATGNNTTFIPTISIPINATASTGYYFVNWTTNCNGTIANISNANTTIQINDTVPCFAQANFFGGIITVSSIKVNPNVPTLVSSLTCNANITSVAYGSYNVNYQWLRNGINQPALAGSAVLTNNTNASVSVLSYPSISPLDNWSCGINASNASDSSGWIYSVNVTEPNETCVIIGSTLTYQGSLVNFSASCFDGSNSSLAAPCVGLNWNATSGVLGNSTTPSGSSVENNTLNVSVVGAGYLINASNNSIPGLSCNLTYSIIPVNIPGQGGTSSYGGASSSPPIQAANSTATPVTTIYTPLAAPGFDLDSWACQSVNVGGYGVSNYIFLFVAGGSVFLASLIIIYYHPKARYMLLVLGSLLFVGYVTIKYVFGGCGP